MTKIPSVSLNNEVKIPQIGLGLWKVTEPDVMDAIVKAGYEAGYRHFDSAQVYKNEDLLQKALVKAEIDRKDVFITTKIGVQNFLRVKKSFEISLEKLDTDYVNLLLLHFPVTGVRKNAWKHLEQIQANGQARAIGVSNFTIRHLKQLLETCQVKPAVNQVELHVYLQQPELLEYCKKQGIAVEAYSPLAHGYGLDNTVLAEIAKRHGKTPAQIMIRWCIELGAIVLPKSSTPTRVVENIDVFDFKLDDEEVARLKELNEDKRTCWDPTHVP